MTTEPGYGLMGTHIDQRLAGRQRVQQLVQSALPHAILTPDPKETNVIALKELTARIGRALAHEPQVLGGFVHAQERMRVQTRAHAIERRIRQVGRLQIRLRRCSAALGDDVAALERHCAALAEMESPDWAGSAKSAIASGPHT